MCVIYICVYVLMCECVFLPASGVRAIYKRKGFCGLQKDLLKASLKCSALQGPTEKDFDL